MSLFDLSDAVSLLSTESFTFTRSLAPTYDDEGVLVPGGTTVLTASGSVQAPQGRELVRLSEAFHGKEMLVVFTSTALQSDPPSDVLSLRGKTWQVAQVEDWANAGNFYRCVIARVEV
jgi:hypothetical protein